MSSPRPHADVSGMKLPAARTPDPASAPSLRWGLLGAGWIASEMARSLRDTSQQVVAVGSRDPRRAQEFVADHVPGARAHGDYASLVADPDVDVVYVASPHSEHLEHALLAIAAGKHVLVEKAMAPTAGEAARIVAAARAAGVFCMEAMWTRFLPHIDVLRQVLDSGILGEVSTVLADHCIPLWPDGPERLASPDLAGGAMLDLGIYPLSFASLALGGIVSATGLGSLTDRGWTGGWPSSCRGRAARWAPWPRTCRSRPRRPRRSTAPGRAWSWRRCSTSPRRCGWSAGTGWSSTR